MPLHLEIADQDRADLVQFYEQKKQSIQQELKRIESNLAKLLSSGNGNYTNSPADSTQNSEILNHIIDSKQDVPWKYKIDDVLKRVNRPLTAAEIYDGLIELEPELAHKSSIRKSISGTLSVNSKDAKTGRYIKKIDKGVYTYKLREGELFMS